MSRWESTSEQSHFTKKSFKSSSKFFYLIIPIWRFATITSVQRITKQQNIQKSFRSIDVLLKLRAVHYHHIILTYDIISHSSNLQRVVNKTNAEKNQVMQNSPRLVPLDDRA